MKEIKLNSKKMKANSEYLKSGRVVAIELETLQKQEQKNMMNWIRYIKEQY